jgi:hypothetical protein
VKRKERKERKAGRKRLPDAEIWKEGCEGRKEG